MVLYGHKPTLEAEWVNGAMCLDTGGVFGGKLTALRYPEKLVVSVPAERTWFEPVKALAPAEAAGPGREPGMLKIEDVLGRRQLIETRTHGRIGVREQYAPVHWKS